MSLIIMSRQSFDIVVTALSNAFLFYVWTDNKFMYLYKFINLYVYYPSTNRQGPFGSTIL